jgi:3-methyladenine DNA glycosylase/8-oxoguanine DNA glycosylase
MRLCQETPVSFSFLLGFCFDVNFTASLLNLQGIGPWTAQYIAMRGIGEPDAFPDADLGIRKALENETPTRCNIGRKFILKRADIWRPWRAYVAMYLWHSHQ